MKALNNYLRIGFIFVLTFSVLTMYAQRTQIQYFRSYDKDGLNVFEPKKADAPEYDGFKVRIGGAFTQQFQAISHENNADKVVVSETDDRNLNELYNLGNGFNLATANLNFDFQLEDGIRVSLENYMSSRHHSEFWVKGGYIQIDKLPMLGNPDWFSKYLRVKIGHFQPNFGDQQFRRSDNGNAIYNPFVGNYIMDAFTTEIGAEAYLFPTNDLMVMVGLTNGMITGNINNYADGKAPSVYVKLAYDKAFDDLRFRLSGSLVSNSNSPRNTLYGGDRTGSRFYLAMEPAIFRNYRAGGAIQNTSAGDRFTSGRYNPGFTNQVMSMQFSPFLKYKGLEFFGTYEIATGKSGSDAPERAFNQFGAELIYRFLANEQLYLAARYNQVSGEDPSSNEISIDRMEIAAGWFTTRNLLLKAEYVVQNYNDFPSADYRHEGLFNGIIIEAVVGF